MIQSPTDEALISSLRAIANNPAIPAQVFKQAIPSVRQKLTEITETLRTAGIFDSVTLIAADDTIEHARNFGYDYIIISQLTTKRLEGGGVSAAVSDVLYEMKSGRREPLGHAATPSDWVRSIDAALDRIGAPPATLPGRPPLPSNPEAPQATAPADTGEEMSYDDRSQKGWVSIRGRGLAARSQLLRRIEEICATKNVALTAGQRPPPGAGFRITDEELKDGVLKIHFEALF